MRQSPPSGGSSYAALPISKQGIWSLNKGNPPCSLYSVDFSDANFAISDAENSVQSKSHVTYSAWFVTA